jgi:uncharacterized protein YjiK
MNFLKLVWLFIFLFRTCTPGACESKKESFPKSYRLDQYQKITLPDALEEISGLEWVGEDQLWAIEDESSAIYKVNPQTGKVLEKDKFAKNKDIEDLLVADGTAYVLQSNGTIYQVTSPFTKDNETKEFRFPIKEKRDLETILASPTEPYLYVFCKVCKWDEGPDKSSIFRFDKTTLSYDSMPFAALKRENIQPLLKASSSRQLQIQPSAAAFHPIEQKFYIISSRGKWLMITDLDFTPQEVYSLDPGIFKQPEGITFDTKGNMYISNEAQDGEPNILIFGYNP